MDCFLDFCLACDKQTIFGGAYCSQACRLADLDRARSPPQSPTSPMTSSSPFASSTPVGSTGSGFYLPPAVNFSNYKTPLVLQASSSSTSQQTSSFQHAPLHTSTPQHTLTPSSSRSSLTFGLIGLQSQASSGLSEQAKSELRDYVSAFDTSREWRRRSEPSCFYRTNSIASGVKQPGSYSNEHN